MTTSASLLACVFCAALPVLRCLAMTPPNFDLNDLEKRQNELKQQLDDVQQQIRLVQAENRWRPQNHVKDFEETKTDFPNRSNTQPDVSQKVTAALPHAAEDNQVFSKQNSAESTKDELFEPLEEAITTISTTLSSTVATTTPYLFSKSRTRKRPISTPSFREVLVQNLTEHCRRWDRSHLINQLKVHGTYNPDFMAWDVSGVRRFLMNSVGAYDEQEPYTDRYPMVQKNLDALEKMISDLDLKSCDVQSTEMKEKLHNITSDLRDYYEYKIDTSDPFQAMRQRRRRKRQQLYYLEEQISLDQIQMPFGISRNEALAIAQLIRRYNSADMVRFAFSHDDPEVDDVPVQQSDQDGFDGIGTRHVYECEKRGSMHDGYLRMCATCRGIRWMPKQFFPPFINEVLCEKEKSCLYFYDYPHGKCLQKHLNFQILQNIGTDECQVWQKYDLNVPVCCECFVDHMSFFAKYV